MNLNINENLNSYRSIIRRDNLNENDFYVQLVFEKFFLCLFRDLESFNIIIKLLEYTKNFNERSFQVYNSILFFKRIGLSNKDNFISLLSQTNLLNCDLINIESFTLLYFNIVFNLLRCFPNKLSLYFELGRWFCEFFLLPTKSHEQFVFIGERIIKLFGSVFNQYFIIRELNVSNFTELSYIKIVGEISVQYRLDTLRLNFQSNFGNLDSLLDLQCLFYLFPSSIPCRPFVYGNMSNHFVKIEKVCNFFVHFNVLSTYNVYHNKVLYSDIYIINLIEKLYGSSFSLNHNMLRFLIEKEPDMWKKLELEFISKIIDSRDRKFKLIKKLRRLVSKDKSYTKMYFNYRQQWEAEGLFLSQYKSFERLLLMFLRFPSTNFFFSYRFDTKLNLYPHQFDLSPAGSQIYRSLLKFSEFKTFDYYIFKLYTSSIFSKIKLNEKHLLDLFNTKLINILLSFPVGLNKIWQQAKEPFLFIACCFEYQQFVRFGKLKKNIGLEYKSNFICYLNFDKNILKINNIFLIINKLSNYTLVLNLKLDPLDWCLSDYERKLLVFILLENKKSSLKYFLDFIIFLKFVSQNKLILIYFNKVGLHSSDIKNLFVEMNKESSWLKKNLNLCKIRKDFKLISPFFSNNNYIKKCTIYFRNFRSMYF